MPEGYTMQFQKGEYPELEGLGENAEVDFKGRARITEEGNQVNMEITDMQFETEGAADKDLKSLRGQTSAGPKNDQAIEGGQF